MIPDDELDAALRATRPDYARTGHLSARAETHMQQLLADTAPEDELARRRTARRRRVGWLGGAAAAALTAIVVTVSLVAVPSRPSFAATPPMPQFSHVDGAASPLLEGLAARAATQPDTTSAGPHTVSYQSWTLSGELDDNGKPAATYIQPQQVTVTHGNPDATVIISAGVPYYGDGAAVPHASTAPGTVISEYTTPVPIPSPPTEPGDWAGYLDDAFGIGSNPAAGDILLQLPSILDFWTLTPAQNNALLQYLSTRPDLTVAGSTSDRLDRHGLAFHSSPLRDDWQPTVIIDPDTGRILAVDVLYVGQTRTDIPSPSVIEYTTWN